MKQGIVSNAVAVTFTGSTSADVSNHDKVQLIQDVIEKMLSQENIYRDAHDAARDDIFQRSLVVEWTFQIVDRYELEEDIATIAISYYDRFMARYRGLVLDDVRANNLMALCSLQLAVKVHVPLSRKKSKALVALSSSMFDAATILEGEFQLLKTLSWRVHPPTAMSFIVYLMMLLSHALPGITQNISTGAIAAVAIAHLKLEVKKHDLASTKPSLMAVTSILHAVDRLSLAADPEVLKSYELSIKFMFRLFPSFAGQLNLAP